MSSAQLVVNTTNGALNYEETPQQAFHLIAHDTNWDAGTDTDDGRPALSATASIKILLVDANDPPQLSTEDGLSSIDVAMPRDLLPNAEIISLAAYVHDEDTDSVLHFALDDDANANMGARWLMLNPETGSLTLADARAYCDAMKCTDNLNTCNSMTCDDDGLTRDAEGNADDGYADGEVITATITVRDQHGEEVSLSLAITFTTPTGNLVRARSITIPAVFDRTLVSHASPFHKRIKSRRFWTSLPRSTSRSPKIFRWERQSVPPQIQQSAPSLPTSKMARL